MSGRLFVVGLATAATASIIPRNSEQECCFSITSSGGVSGTLGQLYDGQNRVGPYAPASYCVKNGGLYDDKGRGCILTPPTTQWQCDEGAAPTYGFSVGPDGSARYNGSPEFWACPVNDYGEWNFYTVPVKDQKKCVQVMLHTSSQCGAPAPPPPPPPPPPAPPAPPAPPVSSPPAPAPPAPPVYQPPPAPSSSSAPPPVYQPPPPPPSAPPAPVYHQPPPPPPPPPSYAPPPPPPAPPAPPVYHSPPPPEHKPTSSAPEYKPTSSAPEYKPTTSQAVYHAPESSAAYAAPSSTGYACNPAHEYPEGVKCVSTNGSLALVTPTAMP